MKRLLSLTLDEHDEHVFSKLKKMVPDYYSMPVKDIIDAKINHAQVNQIAHEVHDKLAATNSDDMKNEYAAIVKTYTKLEGATHKRKFAISEPNQPEYVSHVYLTKDHVVKVYIYDCDASNPSDFMIIKEIAFQKYALSLMGKDNCGFKTPNILKYGKLNTQDGKCVFYIVMENLTHERLDKALIKNENFTKPGICNDLANKLNTLNSCLEDNQLFHNDFHHENIMIGMNPNTNEIDVALIDYGEASDEMKNLDTREYSCDSLLKLKQFASKPHAPQEGGVKRKTISKKRSKNRIHKTHHRKLYSKRSRKHVRSMNIKLRRTMHKKR